MAFRITRDCIACGACIMKCTNKAIFVNDADEYAINPERCTECVDLGRRNCFQICTMDAIQPGAIETKEELWAKHRKLRASTKAAPGEWW
jgi:ferredoxin